MEFFKTYRGLFWYCGEENGNPKLLCRKLPWNDNSSRLNHQKEWEQMDKTLIGVHPFNYYPRGRVENHKGKARIFLHPTLCTDEILSSIYREFGLNKPGLEVQIIADGSAHYRPLME